MGRLNILLTVDEANLVLGALGKLQAELVIDLILNIKGQAEAQMPPPVVEAVPEPVKEPEESSA